MLVPVVVAILLALLAPFGTGLPVGPSHLASSITYGPIEDASSPDHRRFGNSSSFGIGSVTNSPPTKVVRQVNPTQTPAGPATAVPQWPFDAPANNRPAEYCKDSYLYHCNVYAQKYNRIPPSGLTLQYTGEVKQGEELAQGVTYSQEEIYQAFRWGAMVLYSTHQNIINLYQFQQEFNGESFPRPLKMPAGMALSRPFVGLGSWTAAYGTGASGGSTEVYEYPITGAMTWPQSIPAESPGHDRVVFQLSGGVPLYLGVLTYRSVLPAREGDWGRNPSWGYITNANSRPDRGALESLHYPGQEPAHPKKPDPKQITNLRNRIRYIKNGAGFWGQSYPDNPPPPAPAPGNPGTGAGGSGGNIPDKGPGGVGNSAGGTAGNEGGLAVYGTIPMVGNIFLKNQPAFMMGPSHVEL